MLLRIPMLLLYSVVRTGMEVVISPQRGMILRKPGSACLFRVPLNQAQYLCFDVSLQDLKPYLGCSCYVSQRFPVSIYKSHPVTAN